MEFYFQFTFNPDPWPCSRIDGNPSFLIVRASRHSSIVEPDGKHSKLTTQEPIMSSTSDAAGSAPSAGGSPQSARRAHDERIAQQWYQPVIARAVLKERMKRSDAAGWKNFGPWLALLVISGVIAAFSWGTWWAVPAFFVYGPLARARARHAVQDPLDERRVLSPVVVHDDP
jgi:hypothetical protein